MDLSDFGSGIQLLRSGTGL